MGLLSEPESGGGAWGRAVREWGGAAGAACWLTALAWLIALSHPSLSNRTYFSENALLPGLVRSDLPHELAHAAETLHAELLHELQDKYGGGEEMPVAWLAGKMAQMHLDTFVHNFSLHYPLYGQQEWSGSNVYGVLRGSGAGLEALLVCAPYRPLSSHLPASTAGLALMLAFAQHARAQRYWAKDIIFLVTQHEQLGMQAWLEAYHAPPAPHAWRDSLAALHAAAAPPPPPPSAEGWLRAGELPARAGHIQAAVNLDIPSPDIKYVVVRGEGVNGAACNLDLLNLVHRLCDKSDVPHSHTHTYSRRTHSRPIYSLLQQVVDRAGGAPSGNHGLLQRYGVEGVSLEGRAGGEGGDAARLSGVGWRRLMLVLEGTLRSLNNLLERFHQSYFFYLLVDVDRFVSIGQYMVTVCLACVALLLRALSLCLAPAPAHAPAPAPTAALCNWLALHAVSLLLMLSVSLAPRIGAWWGWRTEASVLGWSAAASALLAAAALMPRRRAALPLALPLALLQLACAALCLALLNPAAGLLLAALYTPLALAVGGAVWRGVQVAWCLVLHPLVLLCVALAGYSALAFPAEPLPSALARALPAAQQATLFSLLDYHIYGNWLWLWNWCVLLPAWTALWQVANTPRQPPSAHPTH